MKEGQNDPGTIIFLKPQMEKDLVEIAAIAYEE